MTHIHFWVTEPQDKMHGFRPPTYSLECALSRQRRRLQTLRTFGRKLVFERIALGTAAMGWWIACEYLRTKTSKPATARFLSVSGYLGGFALVVLAVLV
jgi:hypothetical protein